MGNLLPLLIWAPPVVGGLAHIFRARNVTAAGIEFLAVGQVLGVAALNYLGLFENREMRSALRREFDILLPNHRGYSLFVGFADGTYSGLLDPHQDVGILYFGPEHLEFIGDSRSLRVPRTSIVAVRLRSNIHTFLGLGGWVCVYGVFDGKPFEWRFEPRERDTLLGNRRIRSSLFEHVVNWKNRSGPQADRPGAR